MEVVRTPATLKQLELGLVRKVLQLAPEQKLALARGYLQIFGRLSLPQTTAILDPNGNEGDKDKASDQLELFYINHRLFESPEPGTPGFDVWEARQREFYEHARRLIPDLKEDDLSQLTRFSAVATEGFVGIIAPDNLLFRERTSRAFRWSEGAYKLGI